LTLTGNNLYTGKTAVNAGKLIAGSVNALGAPAGGTTVASVATLEVKDIAIGAEPITLNGGTLAGTGAAASLILNQALASGRHSDRGDSCDFDECFR
jgi:autotransporter-associated beta strand protein